MLAPFFPPFLGQVSAYSGEVEAEMKGKVLIRLQNITDLQERLEDYLSGTVSEWAQKPSA